MTTLLKIVALMLLTVAAVKGADNPTPSSIPSSTDISTCGTGGSYTYNVTTGAHHLNGQEVVGLTTVDACKMACNQNASCTGFDFDTLLSKCFLTGPWSTPSPNASPGVDHYTITRTAGTTAACSIDCTAKWSSVFPNTNTYGGKTASAQTLVDCQAACVADPTCSGVDWDPNNLLGQKCWLSPASATKRQGLSPGVDHYDLMSRPPAQCQQGCILFGLSGAAAMAYDSTGFVYPTTNIEDAAVFTETNCLITGVSRANLTGITDTCVSYQLADRPGYYLRNYNGRLRIDMLDVVSPDRFNEDVSFLKLNMTNGNFAFSPVLFRDMYITASLTIGSVLDQYYCYPAPTSDLAIVPGSCPVYWSRVNNAKAAGVTSGTGICRSSYMYPGLVGVSQSDSSSSASCYYLTDSQTSVKLVPDVSYTHYDYWKNVPQRCQRGCVYSWSPPSSNPNSKNFYRLEQFTATHVQSCFKKCIVTYRDVCTAVLFTITGAPGLCTILTDNVNYDNYNWYTYTSYWMLYPIYTDCGKCVSSVGYVYDSSDNGAINVGPITGSGQCLTICLNRRKCYGYETRNGSCYITTFKNVTYATAPGSRYTQVYRSPCGNGCVHEWDFYVDSKMESGASVIAAPATAMTETLCRKACIDNPACTGIDWYQNTMNCTLGLNYPSVNYRTPSTMGCNHYELQRDVACD